MAQNVEIKARVGDWGRVCGVAASLTDGEAVVFEQVDTFFCSAAGRVKVRRFSSDRGELILYCRDDSTAPVCSEYSITPTSDPDGLAAALAETLGVRGVVRKVRWLYMAGCTRTHLDRVGGFSGTRVL